MKLRPVLFLVTILFVYVSTLAPAMIHVPAYGATSYQSTPDYSIHDPQLITANYTYSITPTGASPSIRVNLLQSLPYLNVTRTVVLVNPKRTYMVTESTDELGNLVATMRFQSVRVGEKLTVTFLQWAIVYSIKFNIDVKAVGAYDKASSLYRMYTGPAQYIESNHPEIVSASKQIVGNETNPYLKAQKIFYFVVHHVRRDWSLATFNPDTEGALFALRTGRGVCRHFSALFTALARAAGIPTAMIWGSWGIGDVDKHDWAHFYLPNYGWVPVEATAGDSLSNVDQWFAQIPDNTHVPVISVQYVYQIAQCSGCSVQSLVPREAPLLSQGARSPPITRYQYATILDAVHMQRRTLKVTVNYAAEDEKWAGHVADLTHRSLPRIEELAGFPYTFNYDVAIYIQKGDNNYNNYDRGIFLIPETWDFAVLHELAHYWTSIYGMGGATGKRWLQEAFATLIPLVIFEERVEVAKILEVRAAHLWWFQQFFSKYEQPLDVWKGEETKDIHDFLYGKTYCFIYILYREFGIKTLAEVSRKIYESRRVADSASFRDTLQTATGKNLGDLFSGWVFGKSYKKYGPEDFTDQDNDGLLMIDERFLGTDPMNSDTDGDGIRDGEDPHPVDFVPENASKLIANAEEAVRKAEQEGRTQGLDLTRRRLEAARSAYASGEYDTAASIAREALELAEKAAVPGTTTTQTATTFPTRADWLKGDWLYLAGLIVFLVIAVPLIARKMRGTERGRSHSIWDSEAGDSPAEAETNPREDEAAY